MTLLTLDVGNSHTAIGLFVADELVVDFLVSSNEHRTGDEWYLLIESLLDSTDLPEIDEISMCTTVPIILEQLRLCIDRHYPDVPAWIVGPGVRTGVAIHTDNPREVGADRIVNALAAAELYGGPAIVVDLNGTATVFDAVDAKGTYVGGSIAPGVEASLEALSSRSAQLRSVELVAPRSVIGKNTVEAIQSGAVFGFAGLVDGIVGRMVDALGGSAAEVSVIATGTHASSVLAECTSITDTEPKLTLLGLHLVAERNRQEQATKHKPPRTSHSSTS